MPARVLEHRARLLVPCNPFFLKHLPPQPPPNGAFRSNLFPPHSSAAGKNTLALPLPPPANCKLTFPPCISRISRWHAPAPKANPKPGSFSLPRINRIYAPRLPLSSDAPPPPHPHAI